MSNIVRNQSRKSFGKDTIQEECNLGEAAEGTGVVSRKRGPAFLFQIAMKMFMSENR